MYEGSYLHALYTDTSSVLGSQHREAASLAESVELWIKFDCCAGCAVGQCGLVQQPVLGLCSALLDTIRPVGYLLLGAHSSDPGSGAGGQVGALQVLPGHHECRPPHVMKSLWCIELKCCWAANCQIQA